MFFLGAIGNRNGARGGGGGHWNNVQSSLNTWTCICVGEGGALNSKIRFINTSVKCKLNLLIVKFLHIFNKNVSIDLTYFWILQVDPFVVEDLQQFVKLLSLRPRGRQPHALHGVWGWHYHSTQILGFNFSLFLFLRHDIFFWKIIIFTYIT